MMRNSALLLALVIGAGVLGLAAGLSVHNITSIRLPISSGCGGGESAGEDLRVRLLRLAAGLSADDVDAAASIIHLPSDDGAGGSPPPWECCNLPFCDTSTTPPTCFCADLVDSCNGCKQCGPWPGDVDGRFLCTDSYQTYPPPPCPVRPARPWECCDEPLCLPTCPTVCQCGDRVDKCPPLCNSCELVEQDPPRYYCYDLYAGTPWPTCKA